MKGKCIQNLILAYFQTNVKGRNDNLSSSLLAYSLAVIAVALGVKNWSSEREVSGPELERAVSISWGEAEKGKKKKEKEINVAAFSYITEKTDIVFAFSSSYF